MTLSLGFIYLATHLTRLWIKERRTSCLKIGDELSGANCPGGELSGYPNERSPFFFISPMENRRRFIEIRCGHSRVQPALKTR